MGGNERGKREEEEVEEGACSALRPRGGGARHGKEGMVLGSHNSVEQETVLSL